MIPAGTPVPWRDLALCRQTDPDLWHPAGTGPQAAAQTRQAQQICARCPVIEACLRAALDIERGAGAARRHGIWGGLTARQRHRLDTTSPGRRPAYALAPCGTLAAYRRHQRYGEVPCQRCREENARALADRKARAEDGPRRAPTAHPKCGTTAGYKRHLRDHETPCDACRAANARRRTAATRTAA